MAKQNDNYRRKLTPDDNLEALPIEFETIPPQKGSTEAQKPNIDIKLWQEGDECIILKLEGPERGKDETEQSK